MKIFRNKTLFTFFCNVMAVLVLNLSIDPPDLLVNLDNDIAFEEDLSINEMESVAEVILEKALEIDNALPETDDQDNDNIIKKVEVCSRLYTFYFEQRNTLINSFAFHITEKPFHFFDIYLEAFSPPPEA